jgi:long-subunit acyl-CoA synthetase (AMP-forming)
MRLLIVFSYTCKYLEKCAIAALFDNMRMPISEGYGLTETSWGIEFLIHFCPKTRM